MNIKATADLTEETHREMWRISLATGKKLSFLYREAIEEYARNHKAGGGLEHPE